MTALQRYPSAAKPTFYQRDSRLILATVLVVFPVLAYGANRAAQTNRNDVKDWLPATFAETQDYHWFQSHFENETQVLVSWEGAMLDDPRVEKFARLVAPRSEQDQTPIDTKLFSSVLTGPELVRRLTDPPTNLPRSKRSMRLSGLLVGKDGKQTSAVVSLTQYGARQVAPHARRTLSRRGASHGLAAWRDLHGRAPRR